MFSIVESLGLIIYKKNESFDSETIGPPNSKNHNHNSKNRNHIQIITPFASLAYDHLLIFNIMY